jgi:hypothetical protein
MVSTLILIDKINQSTLPSILKRWVANYLTGRQCRTEYQGVKSDCRVIHAGVPQGSIISPCLFNFYVCDTPIPGGNVHLVSYADDFTIFATGPNVPALEREVNEYLVTLAAHLLALKLELSSTKSTATLFTPDTNQYRHIPSIVINGSRIPLDKTPKILGVTFDTMNSFRAHTDIIVQKAQKRCNILKALAGTTWGQAKEDLVITYKALIRPVLEYAAPVWTPNLSASNNKKIERVQSRGLRTATGCLMSTQVEHLNTETKVMPVEAHSSLLSTQFLARCRQENHPCYAAVTHPMPPRLMRQSIQQRHNPSVQSVLDEGLSVNEPTHRKAISNRLHTKAVSHAIMSCKKNLVLNEHPPPVHQSEELLPRNTRCKLAQLRSGECNLLQTWQHRVNENIPDNCPRCNLEPDTTQHLFNCTATPMQLQPIDLWLQPVEAARALSFILDTPPN